MVWLGLLSLLATLTCIHAAPVGPAKSKEEVGFLRKWALYDWDCEFLGKEAFQKKLAAGACLPRDYDQQEKEKEKEFFYEDDEYDEKNRKKLTKEKKKKGLRKALNNMLISKKKFLKLLSMGRQIVVDWVAQASGSQKMIIAGMMLALQCPRKDTDREFRKVEWYLNGHLIKPSYLDWRIRQQSSGDLEIWPTQLYDSGMYECYVRREFRGSAEIEFITLLNSILLGFVNYAYVLAIFTPVLSIGIFRIMRRKHDLRQTLILDPVAAFFEKQIEISEVNVKENIANAVYGKKREEMREKVQKTIMLGVDEKGSKARNNRDTIMTILSVHDEPKAVAPA